MGDLEGHEASTHDAIVQLDRETDVAKEVVQSDTIKMDEEMSDENISSEDSLIDAEKIDVNEREIRKIYVSLMKLFCVDLNVNARSV